MSTRPPGRGDNPPAGVVPPVVSVPTIAVVRWGMALWALVLVVVLAVPVLRTDERSWWVWVPVAGLGVGALGWSYLSRGRGNAADAGWEVSERRRRRPGRRAPANPE